MNRWHTFSFAILPQRQKLTWNWPIHPRAGTGSLWFLRVYLIIELQCFTDDVDVVPLVVRVFFGQLLENLRIVVGNLRKLVKNNKLLVDIEFLFSCLILYLAGDLCSLVRYRVEHSKRYCISIRVYILLYMRTFFYNILFRNPSNSPQCSLFATIFVTLNNLLFFYVFQFAKRYFEVRFHGFVHRKNEFIITLQSSA